MSGHDVNSVWTESVKYVGFSPLHENKNTDVLIIGGGITKNTTAKKKPGFTQRYRGEP